jgi:hypothetical protein
MRSTICASPGKVESPEPLFNVSCAACTASKQESLKDQCERKGGDSAEARRALVSLQDLIRLIAKLNTLPPALQRRAGAAQSR